MRRPPLGWSQASGWWWGWVGGQHRLQEVQPGLGRSGLRLPSSGSSTRSSRPALPAAQVVTPEVQAAGLTAPRPWPSPSWGCRWHQPEPLRAQTPAPPPPSQALRSGCQVPLRQDIRGPPPPRSPCCAPRASRANGRAGQGGCSGQRGARLRSAGGQRGKLGLAGGVRLAPPSTPSPCAVGLGVRARGVRGRGLLGATCAPLLGSRPPPEHLAGATAGRGDPRTGDGGQ